MNLNTLTLIVKGAAAVGGSFLPPPVATAINTALGAINSVESALADEARLRGIPPEDLRQQLIAELDQAFPQVKNNIADRIARIEGSHAE